MKEQIDVLLATYNGEKYLREQIDSILNQTYKNIKLIISDDCSKDETANILKKYAKKDNRIELYIQKENLGVVKNIEFLLKQVKSPYYMLADQDDYWLPEKAERTLATLKEQNVDLAFCDLEVVNEKLETIYPSFNEYMLLSRKINKYINNYKMNYLYNCVTGCTVLAKKETIEYILPLPTNSKHLIHDYWIGIMVAVKGKMTYVPEKLIKYRQHGNNQVGTSKISHGFSEFEQVRNWFTEVKLGIFETYVKNNNRFPKEIQKLNKEAYEYYKMIKTKKYFNFRKWNVFHNLYRTEKFMYYIENFLIMNVPCVASILFKVRYGILKILRKR